MNKHIYLVLFLLFSQFFSGKLLAQTGVGSATLDNSTVVIAPGTVELRFSESSYFGPNSHWEINGTLEIWSKQIWIAPTATFSGTGRIIIHDPSTNPFYENMTSGATVIDGNDGEFIGVGIELRNPDNLVLGDIADPGYGTTNPTGAASATLNIGANFMFAVDGGDVLLSGNNFGIGPQGTLEGYNSSRMIVTGNSLSGHVIKTYANTQPFVFPVGIAEGDYTPATLSPEQVSTLFVSVQDYSAAGVTLPDEERGMDRIWHIYASTGVNTLFTLQHNSITNGQAYVDADAEIIQHAGSGNWIGDVTVVEAVGVHTRADILTATAADEASSFITKYTFANDVPPIANDDTAAVEAGSSVQISVLANDLPGSSPIRVGSVRIVRQPASGMVVVNADGSVTYTPNAGFVGVDTFDYEIEDENGLTDIATVTVTVTPRLLRIPNTFTPNGDGLNDLFEIEGLEGFDRVELVVVNRWGNEVYRSDNYRNTWDGGNLTEGTYYYHIITHRGNERTPYSGWVLIKRL